MVNFCTNCGSKVRKDDNFCINCGAKIIKEDNFCINCGAKIRKDDNFCMNCGLKIEKSNKKPAPSLKELFSQTMEKNKAKLEEEKNKTVQKREEETNKSKVENVKIIKETELKPKTIEESEMTHGGYCSLNCRHCYEEFFDGGGSIVGDFDSEGYVEYYCRLGHQLSFGHFCQDYE